MIGIWAVAWNTIIGPVAFGLMVKYFGQRVIDSHWGDSARLKNERQESIYGVPTYNTEAMTTQETKVKGTGTQDKSDV